MSDVILKLAEVLVSQVAKDRGVNLPVEAIIEYGAAALGHVGDLVTGKVKREAQEAADAAADQVTNFETAEQSAKRTK